MAKIRRRAKPEVEEESENGRKKAGKEQETENARKNSEDGKRGSEDKEGNEDIVEHPIYECITPLR